MSNTPQPSNSLVDAFFRLFSSDKASNEAKTPNPTFDREWKRQNAEPVPGIVKPVRNSGNQHAPQSLSSSNSSMSHSSPDLPTATPHETPLKGSLKMANGSLKHDELARSSSSTGLNGSGKVRRDVGAEVPFVIVDPKLKRFRTQLANENVDLEALAKLAWNGVPEEFRGQAWRLLLGYSPPGSSRREPVLARKREEYADLVNRYYIDLSTNELKPEWVATISNQQSGLIHQIRIDVPRTLPHIPLFTNPIIQRALERILLMWALRHPASGYVQGINDLVTPFFVVFLREILNMKSAASPEARSSDQSSSNGDEARRSDTSSKGSTGFNTALEATAEVEVDERGREESPRSEKSVDSDASEDEKRPKKFSRTQEELNIDLSLVSPEEMSQVEADCYWAVSKFIDCIQDNYTPSQPGIQRSLHRLAELVGKIDPPLFQHLQSQGVLFVQFAFRWVNCLLMRELPLNLVIRLWDTYIAEGDRFPTLHTYVCASFLLSFSKDLISSDFQNLMMFLHHPPTDNWSVQTFEPLISQAFMWQTLYGDSTQHLKAS